MKLEGPNCNNLRVRSLFLMFKADFKYTPFIGEMITIDNKTYRVDRVLGTGADSTVFVGTALPKPGTKERETKVAIKSQPRHKKTVYQVTTEITVLTDLERSKGKEKLDDGRLFVQRAFAYGLHEDKCYVLVTELLGPSLQWMFEASGGRLDKKLVLALAKQSVSLLRALHKRGWVHRDIKPDNIVAGAEGKFEFFLHLIDFGTAERLLDRHGNPRSDLQQIEGTRSFMAVSVHQCKPVSARDDLEAMGWTLLKLYRGSLPWDGVLDINRVLREKQQVLREGVSALLVRDQKNKCFCDWTAVNDGNRAHVSSMAPFFDRFLAGASQPGERAYEEMTEAVAFML
jgi:serine/threonine protein kinase